MRWKVILKADEPFDWTPEDYTYDVTIDMFADQNWMKVIKSVLTPNMPTVMQDFIDLTPKMAMELLDSMLKHSDLGKVIEESSEKYEEGTKLFADEKEIVNPQQGSAGRGMMPKRMEYLVKQTSRVIGDIISSMLKTIHNTLDKSMEEGTLPSTFQDAQLDAEIENRVWDLVSDALIPNAIEDSIEAASKTIAVNLKDISEVNINYPNIMSSVMRNPTTKDWSVLLYLLASNTIIEGLAGRSMDKDFKRRLFTRFFGDILSDKEFDFMMRNAKYDSVSGSFLLPTDELGIPKEFNMIEDTDEAQEAYQKWIQARRKEEEELTDEEDDESISRFASYDEEGNLLDTDDYDEFGNKLAMEKAFKKAWKIIKGCRTCGGSNMFDMRL